VSTRIPTSSPERYHALHGGGQTATLINLRTPDEYRTGHAAGVVPKRFQPNLLTQSDRGETNIIFRQLLDHESST